MDPLAANLVLLAALLHAGWNTLVKVSGDRLAVMGMMAAGNGGLALLVVPWVPIPPAAAWPFILLSILVHSVYRLTLVRAYRDGALSQVYPIARGAAPILVLLFAYVFFGETVSPLALLAVVMASLAIASLALHQGQVLAQGRPVFWALATATAIAAYTVVDGAGARLSESALSYAAWCTCLGGLTFAIGVLAVRGRAMATLMRQNLGVGLLGASMSLVAYWLVLWAMTQAPMATVSAMRETSVLFGALIGVVILREGFGRWRIASAVVLAGACGLLRF